MNDDEKTELARDIGLALGIAMPALAKFPPTDDAAVKKTVAALDRKIDFLRTAGAPPQAIELIEAMTAAIKMTPTGKA